MSFNPALLVAIYLSGKFEVDSLYGCHVTGKVSKFLKSLNFKFKCPNLYINGSFVNPALLRVTFCMCVEFEVDTMNVCHAISKVKVFKKLKF